MDISIAEIHKNILYLQLSIYLLLQTLNLVTREVECSLIL